VYGNPGSDSLMIYSVYGNPHDLRVFCVVETLAEAH
jgi:hypothetical protein